MTNKKNEVKVFTFNESNQPIRVKVVNGEPWFVAKDVCRVLEHSNHKMAIKSLDEDEVSSVYLIDIMGRQQETKVVSESGLYSLIFQSRKPEARKFRRWVTSEVLPSIRKTGTYSAVPASRPVRLLPREQGVEWERFYAELTRCTTRADEELVAGLLKVSRKHVHDVATGRKRGYGVCCMLVDCAKENKAKGITRLVRDRAAEMDALRQELMSDFDGREG